METVSNDNVLIYWSITPDSSGTTDLILPHALADGHPGQGLPFRRRYNLELRPRRFHRGHCYSHLGDVGYLAGGGTTRSTSLFPEEP